MKKTALFMLMAMFVINAFAQSSVIGIVKDKFSNSPLEGANITVDGENKGSSTDSNGMFTIDNLNAGKTTLIISYVGYKTHKKTINLIDNDTQNLDLFLEPVIETTEKMVTTATRRPNQLKNVPEIVFLVDNKEIEQTQTSNVSDVLHYLPGINVEGGTGSGQPFKKMITIDGLPSQYSLVLMNGSRIVSSHWHTGANVNILPSENIQSIEVVKGATSAQYGSDGIGGVLNILSKKGTKKPEMLFNIYGGTRNTFHAALSLRGPINEKVRYSSFASWHQSDSDSVIAPVFRIGALNYTTLTLMERIDADICSKSTLAAEIFYMNAVYPYKDADEYGSWLYTPKLEFKSKISEKFALNTSAYYTEWRSERNSEINEIAEPDMNIGYSGITNNYLLLGAQYKWSNFRRNKVPENDQTAFGVYVQDEWAISQKFDLLTAVRMDKVEEIDAVISPKVTVLYKTNENLNLRASVGRGFRAPSVQDLYETLYFHGTSIHYRAGNKDLKPEYSTSITAGAEYDLSSKFSLMLNGYYTALTDMITPVDHGLENPFDYFDPEEIPTVTDTLVYIYRRENVHKAIVYGGELKAIWNFIPSMNLDASVNYTFNENQDTEESLPYFPGLAASVKLTGNHEITPNINFSGFVGVNATSGRKIWKFKHDSDQQVDLEDYQKLDAGLTVSFKEKYDLYFTAENLLGQEIQMYEDTDYILAGEISMKAGLRILAF